MLFSGGPSSLQFTEMAQVEITAGQDGQGLVRNTSLQTVASVRFAFGPHMPSSAGPVCLRFPSNFQLCRGSCGVLVTMGVCWVHGAKSGQELAAHHVRRLSKAQLPAHASVPQGAGDGATCLCATSHVPSFASAHQ